MKVSVEKSSTVCKAQVGQIYLKNGAYYMIVACGLGQVILANLTNGGRWDSPKSIADLQRQIVEDGFKFVNAKELIIREEV